jgi:dihydroorotase
MVDVYPCGTVTKNLKGKEMAEMADMKDGGAIAFSDYKSCIQNPKLLIKSLLYTKAFDGLIIHFPSDEHIVANGQINEGVTSTRLGLKAIPSLSEELIVERDLQLLKYTDHKLHFSLISSPISVQQIKKAKKENCNVSCGVSSYHLLLSEDLLETFDSNYKVLPPLKPKQDISALIKAVKDNTIDVIVSDHCPENIENKNCEFDLAAFGIINLETSFAVANMALKKHLDINEIVEKICHNPRKILGLPTPVIQEGATANFTLFDPDLEWKYSQKEGLSKSTNSPLFDQLLTGKAIGIYNKGQLHMTV